MDPLPRFMPANGLARQARVSRNTVLSMLANGRIQKDGELEIGISVQPLFHAGRVVDVLRALGPQKNLRSK